VEGLQIDEETKQRVFWRNAARLYMPDR